MFTGSLMNAVATPFTPHPALCVLNAARPAGVNGGVCSGLPSDGMAFAPSA